MFSPSFHLRGLADVGNKTGIVFDHYFIEPLFYILYAK